MRIYKITPVIFPNAAPVPYLIGPATTGAPVPLQASAPTARSSGPAMASDAAGLRDALRALELWSADPRIIARLRGDSQAMNTAGLKPGQPLHQMLSGAGLGSSYGVSTGGDPLAYARARGSHSADAGLFPGDDGGGLTLAPDEEGQSNSRPPAGSPPRTRPASEAAWARVARATGGGTNLGGNPAAARLLNPPTVSVTLPNGVQVTGGTGPQRPRGTPAPGQAEPYHKHLFWFGAVGGEDDSFGWWQWLKTVCVAILQDGTVVSGSSDSTDPPGGGWYSSQGQSGGASMMGDRPGYDVGNRGSNTERAQRAIRVLFDGPINQDTNTQVSNDPRALKNILLGVGASDVNKLLVMHLFTTYLYQFNPLKLLGEFLWTVVHYIDVESGVVLSSASGPQWNSA